eukprot:TRINITY_DN187_c0_g1_i1.p2 TRINITY_DN187_c0_g1~~TRINITY_DN187_c0_g1_i1.p2  ORF type:complete len:136 (-),score=41.41 TRINITY_DN187_c0_g1_i1:51-458(-)
MPAKGKEGAKAPAKTAAAASKSTGGKKFTRQSVIAVGLNKGHYTTKRTLAQRGSRRKGTQTKRISFVREVVREVSGYAPYERRILELLRNGLEKRAMKVAKSKLGTRLRAKRKFNEMTDTIRKIREARLKEQEKA